MCDWYQEILLTNYRSDCSGETKRLTDKDLSETVHMHFELQAFSVLSFSLWFWPSTAENKYRSVS